VQHSQRLLWFHCYGLVKYGLVLGGMVSTTRYSGFFSGFYIDGFVSGSNFRILLNIFCPLTHYFYIILYNYYIIFLLFNNNIVNINYKSHLLN
jgi:hypothetical protein